MKTTIDKLKSNYGVSAPEKMPVVEVAAVDVPAEPAAAAVNGPDSWENYPWIVGLRKHLKESPGLGAKLFQSDDGRVSMVFKPGLDFENQERFQAARDALTLLENAVDDIKRLVAAGGMRLPRMPQNEYAAPPKVMTWREKYSAVITSKRWRQLRERFMSQHDSKCRRCGWQKTNWDKSRTLDLHHRTYERIGKERDEDLELICSVCHAKADKERAAQGRQRGSEALYDAQFDGWANKVYGENYYMFEDEWMHDRFCKWQERKEMEDD